MHMVRYLVLLLICLIIGLLCSGEGMAAAAAENTAVAILVDHRMVDPAVIPPGWLDAVRGQDFYFAHQSLGGNILAGMVVLAQQDGQRYTLPLVTAGPDWFASHDGMLHQLLGVNGLPLTKTEGFAAAVQSGFHQADAAMMKFCPADVIPFGSMTAAAIWTAYREMMVGLEQAYPDLHLVWWTIPLASAADDRGNDERAFFNNQVREYCRVNGCTLFDIADIESHDPQGTAVTGPSGYEAMWNGYSDDGGHLNEVGQLRAAGAFWWLLARLAGWPMGGDERIFLPQLMDDRGGG